MHPFVEQILNEPCLPKSLQRDGGVGHPISENHKLFIVGPTIVRKQIQAKRGVYFLTPI